VLDENRRAQTSVKTIAYVALAVAAILTPVFVRALQPTTWTFGVVLAAWLLAPYLALAVWVAVARARQWTATASFVSTFVAAGGMAFLVNILFVHPDPQGGIAVLFMPIYQAAAAAVLIAGTAVVTHGFRGNG
jgi:hypothetical protein